MPISDTSEDGEHDLAQPRVGELYKTHSAEIRSFLRGRVRTDEEAEDLLQQTFLKVLSAAPSTEIKNPAAYLKTTARNLLTDHYRKKQTHRSDSHIEFEDNEHVGSSPSPHRLLQSKEEFGRITQALSSLSRPVARAFLLSRVYGYTYAEIGRILSLSPRTIEKHVAKGLSTCYLFLVNQDRGRQGGNDQDKES